MIVTNLGSARFFNFAPANPSANPYAVISPGIYLNTGDTVVVGDSDAVLAAVQPFIDAGMVSVNSTGGPTEPSGIIAVPSSVKLNQLLGYVTVGNGPNLAGVTALIYTDTILLTLQITGGAVLATVSIPNVTTMPGNFVLASNSLLTSISIPLLATITGSTSINGNNALTTITNALATMTGAVNINNNLGLLALDLSHLVSAPNGMTISGNTSLAALNLAALVPTSTKNYDFSNNALPAAQVNAILARFVANAGYVSGTINLSGGTNAAPTGQGATDKTTLTGRGVTVTTT